VLIAAPGNHSGACRRAFTQRRLNRHLVLHPWLWLHRLAVKHFGPDGCRRFFVKDWPQRACEETEALESVDASAPRSFSLWAGPALYYAPSLHPYVDRSNHCGGVRLPPTGADFWTHFEGHLANHRSPMAGNRFKGGGVNLKDAAGLFQRLLHPRPLRCCLLRPPGEGPLEGAPLLSWVLTSGPT